MVVISRSTFDSNLRILNAAAVADNKVVHLDNARGEVLAFLELDHLKVYCPSNPSNGVRRTYEEAFSRTSPTDREHDRY